MNELSLEEQSYIASLAREDLGIYCQAVDRTYGLHTPHAVLVEALMMVERGEIDRLILTIAPRTGKTKTSCIHFPDWIFWKHPDWKVIISGHTADLVEWSSREARSFLDTPEYQSIFPDTKISPWEDRSSEWKTTERGGLLAVGVWWSVTGRGGRILIVDDPHKDYQDAMSKTKRDRVWEWYRNTFYTRQDDINVSAIIVIQTRWHDDDLVGRLLQQAKDDPEADQWTVVDIPAITPQGESYYPEKYSLENLRRLKKWVWPIAWTAQYMQSPNSDETRIFKTAYIKYYEDHEIPSDLAIYTFQDLAISEKQTADFNAIVTIGVAPNSDVYVLSYVHYQGEPEPDDTFEVVDDWQPLEYGIETVQFQKMYANTINKEMKRRNKFFNLREVQPMGEKHSRIISALHARFARWSVFIKRNMEELEDELQSFPNGKHDDLIDALSGAVIISESPQIQTQKPKKQKDPTRVNMVFKKWRWVAE